MNLTTKYRNAKKEKAIEYLGGICWRCEEVYDREVYDFHHLDPNTKEYSWTVLRRYKWETIKKELDKCIGDSLVATNFCKISNLIDMLNIDTKLKIDYPTELTSTERLVDICVMYGATTYLSGIGAKEYLNESLFEEKGINVEYQKVIDKSSILDIL